MKIIIASSMGVVLVLFGVGAYLVGYNNCQTETVQGYEQQAIIEQNKDSLIGNIEEIKEDQSGVLVENTNNIKVYSVTKEGKSYVMLEKDSETIIVDQGEILKKSHSNAMSKKIFRDVRLSPDKKYVVYNVEFYEGGDIYVYDILNKKNILTLGNAGSIEFTPDAKYVYMCSSAGMGGKRAGKVVQASNFETVFSVFGEIISPETYARNNEYDRIECSYDNVDKKIVFNLMNQGNNKKLEYTLSN